MNRTTTGVAAMSALLLVAPGCGGQGSQSPENAPVRVEISQMFITVENRAGLALTDVKVEIVPYGAPTTFAMTLSRLSNGEKRDLALGSFRGMDGTPFDRRVVRARQVIVTGKDINGNEVKVEVPWK
jgi:hypothetical protein